MYEMAGLKQYQSVNVDSRISAASPHELVAMLLDGILQKLAKATGATERGSIAEKGQHITGAIRIIDNLRASLDLNRGGELAMNLHALYDYMERRLVDANLNSDVNIIAEVNSLVTQIKEGWDAIPMEKRG